MIKEVVVLSVEDGEFYCDDNVSGSTVNVMLKRGNDIASCDGILYWEASSQEELNDVFDVWVAMAMDGEEGYSAMIDDGLETKLYS